MILRVLEDNTPCCSSCVALNRSSCKLDSFAVAWKQETRMHCDSILAQSARFHSSSDASPAVVPAPKEAYR